MSCSEITQDQGTFFAQHLTPVSAESLFLETCWNPFAVQQHKPYPNCKQISILDLLGELW